MATPQLRLLGAPRLDGLEPDSALPLGKPLALLSYLAVTGQPASRAHLVDLLWVDAPPDRGRASLRQALWVLRRTLGADAFRSVDPVDLDPEAVWCDVNALRVCLQKNNVPGARALWAGPFMADFAVPGGQPWRRWVEEVRDGLDSAYSDALERHADVLLSRGEFQAAVGAAVEGAAIAPHRLGLHLIRIEGLLAAGDTPAARVALSEAERETGDIHGAQDVLEDLRSRLDRATALPTLARDDGFGLHIDFVGRTRELARLLRLLEDSARGRGQVTALTGPPGIGKTRLALEALRAASAQGAATVRVKCHRAEQGLAWGAVGDLIVELKHLPGASGTSRRTEELLASLRPSLGNGDTPRVSTEPTAYADAVGDLLEAVSFEAALVLLIDDVQWIDDASRSLLARVARRLPSGATLLLTSRDPLSVDGLLDEGGPPIEVHPLSGDEVREMLEMAATVQPEAESAAVAARLAAVSGGNPLFVGEILKELVDLGAASREGAAWTIDATALPNPWVLPASVQELIGERMARLSQGERQVCAALAHSGGTRTPSQLRADMGMPEADFLRCASQLVVRGVLEWVGPDRIDFTHEHLREVAGGVTTVWSRRRRPWRVGVAAAGLVALLAAGSAWAARASSRPTWASEASDHGFLVLVDPLRGMWEVGLPASRGDSLRLRRLPDFIGPAGEPVHPRGARTVSEGRTEWYGSTFVPALATDLVAVGDGPPRYLLNSEGDESDIRVSPDGSRAVASQEDRSTMEYSRRTLLLDLETGSQLTLYPGTQARNWDGSWSPDGEAYAMPVAGPPDTVIVFRAPGAVADRWVPSLSGTIGRIAWCADSTLVLEDEPGGPRRLLRFTPSGTLVGQLTPPVFVAGGTTCVPGQSPSVAFGGISQGRPQLVVMDVLGDSVLARTELPRFVNDLFWVPNRAVASVTSNELIGTESLRIPWGERSKVPLGDDLARGSPNTAESWGSSDLRVVSVDQQGTVTAIRPGAAWVWRQFNWRRDSVWVEVPEGTPPSLLFREPWDDGWRERWSRFGEPQPRTVETGETRVAYLDGDGRHADGMVSDNDFPADRGLTLDVEFRLEALTRRDRQNLRACLAKTMDPFDGSTALEGICFSYPRGQLATFDPLVAGVSLTSLGTGWAIPVPTSLVGRWVGIRLEIQADGRVWVYVEGKPHELDPDLRVPTEGQRYRIVLTGASVDTEVLVRNLSLWEGVTEAH